MPTRDKTIADATDIYNRLDYPKSLSEATAWLGVYQTLLWYESVHWLGISSLPHIIDADKLRPSTPAKRRSWTKVNAWQKRALSLETYLAEVLGCPTSVLPDKTDLLMKEANYEGMQRQNTLGIAFAGLIKHILERFGCSELQYEMEVDALTIFPGITFPGRSGTPRIDLLVNYNKLPRAIISSKWSLRHDRLSDITNECPVYKAAYERVYRGTKRDHMRFYVITNEYDPSRLIKLLDDTCVDAVVHVHKPAVVDVCKLDGRLDELMDLSELITLTYSWVS
jgi:hypothetical protein